MSHSTIHCKYVLAYNFVPILIICCLSLILNVFILKLKTTVAIDVA